jgi:hypothetical protein
MPRDFDQEFSQDLEFKIAGESFKMRYVRPEVLASWEDESVSEKSEDAIKKIDERIKLFLDQSNGSGERWDSLRVREENPVTMGQLNAVLMWMVEVQSGRPTPPPSPSAPGRGKTAASSGAA